MAFLTALAAGVGLVKGISALWKKVKKPVPKIQVSSSSGEVVASGYQPYGIGGTGIQQVGMNLPALAMGQTQAITQAGPGGLPVPWYKGPGGKLQMPWSDPRIPEYLKQFALDDAYLKIYYRAPKGYVIVRDNSGRPFAVNRAIAKQFGIWRPAAKPPISATEWKHYKRNKIIEKKLRKLAPKAKTRVVYTSKKK